MARSRPDQRRITHSDGDARVGCRVQPRQDRAHLVAADGHAPPGGVAIGDVQEDAGHFARMRWGLDAMFTA